MQLHVIFYHIYFLLYTYNWLHMKYMALYKWFVVNPSLNYTVRMTLWVCTIKSEFATYDPLFPTTSAAILPVALQFLPVGAALRSSQSANSLRKKDGSASGYWRHGLGPRHHCGWHPGSGRSNNCACQCSCEGRWCACRASQRNKVGTAVALRHAAQHQL